MKTASLRDIAQACNCSTATVSRALAGLDVVEAALSKKIQSTAKKLGYNRNPLIGSIMGQLRTRRTNVFKGNLAMVRVVTPGVAQIAFHQRMFDGAKQRALELGFNLDYFSLGEGAHSVPQLTRILKARGVVGLIMLHVQTKAGVGALPWDDFAAIELDYCLNELLLDTILIDHHVTLMRALEKLAVRGYKRGGLFIEQAKDSRLKFKWSAAFRAFQENNGGFGSVPVFRFDQLDETSFMKWYKKHRPDLLIGHRDEVVGWLEKHGVAVPGETGFFNLNWNEHKRPCAGLDLCPQLQGAVAVETVIAHVINHKRGLPKEPHSVLINGRWVDGPTLRD